MRDLKKSDIGIVIGTDTIRAAQSLNGQVLTGSVSLEEESHALQLSPLKPFMHLKSHVPSFFHSLLVFGLLLQHLVPTFSPEHR